jgi:voltage-gated potassium channel
MFLTAFKRHGWLSPLMLKFAILVGAWLPLRMVFFKDCFVCDASTDIVIATLMGLYSFRHKIDPTQATEVEDSIPIFSLAMNILIGFPLVTVLTPFLGPDARYFYFVKLLFLRHLFEIRNIVIAYDTLHPIVARMIPLGFIVPMIVHLFACGWVLLGNGSVGLSPDGNLVLDYFRAVYFTMTTLTTVGYGDMSAVNTNIFQMLYAVSVQVIGVAFFGYVLSNVASMLARMDAAREEHLGRLDKVETFMRYNNLPTEVRGKIRSYYRYLWESHRGYDDNSILSVLPQKLRGEVSLALNAEMIEKVPILKGADHELVEDIVLKMQPRVFVPGERIFHKGEPGDAMYFIYHGTIEIVSGEGHVLATLHPGSFFGEMALLTDNPRNATARASSYCDLYVLDRHDFESVLSRYPNFEKHVKEIAAQRTAPQKSA